MPIGNFPMLQAFMQKQRKPNQQGQQMPSPPAQYMPEQNVAVPQPGAVPSHQPQQAQQGIWGGMQGPSQGQQKQQTFNQQQSAMNTGTPGGRMNRRRY